MIPVLYVDRAGTAFPYVTTHSEVAKVGPLFSNIGGVVMFTAFLSLDQIKEMIPSPLRRYNQLQIGGPRG